MLGMTYRIPVMGEIPTAGPEGGQLLPGVEHEPCALRVDLLEERSIIPLWAFPLGQQGPVLPDTSGIWLGPPALLS